jgi:hypothetical protein
LVALFFMTVPPLARCHRLGEEGGLLVSRAAAGEEDAKLAQKLGQLQLVYSCIPTGMHGSTRIFRASLTPFSLQDMAERLETATKIYGTGLLVRRVRCVMAFAGPPARKGLAFSNQAPETRPGYLRIVQ